ncbi:MAG: hypothetical protein WC242_05460 [Candidatus Paceibacterota bacterium]
MESFFPCSMQVGDLVVINIVGMTELYIAEITQSDPLKMKVAERGPLARLQSGDFLILTVNTFLLQRDLHENTRGFWSMKHKSRILSGLAKLGVKDGKVRRIFHHLVEIR